MLKKTALFLKDGFPNDDKKGEKYQYRCLRTPSYGDDDDDE